MIDLSRGCAERSTKEVFTSSIALSLCNQTREGEGDQGWSVKKME